MQCRWITSAVANATCISKGKSADAPPTRKAVRLVLEAIDALPEAVAAKLADERVIGAMHWFLTGQEVGGFKAWHVAVEEAH